MENTEKVQPGIYHIHFDGKKISDELLARVMNDYKFENTPFSGNLDGYEACYPEIHLTKKTSSVVEFREIWNELDSIVHEENFTGYLEAEYLPIDEKIAWKKYEGNKWNSDDDGPDNVPPFEVALRPLKGKKFDEEFRQCELHLTMDYNKSDSDLIKYLLATNMMHVFIEKEQGTFIVFTVQGHNKVINPLINELRNYLTRVGGAAQCTLKSEKISFYKLIGVNPEQELPSIADNVKYNENFS